LFYQLDNNRDDSIRDRVLKFLHTKVQTLQTEVFTKEIQIFIFTETKKFIPVSLGPYKLKFFSLIFL